QQTRYIYDTALGRLTQVQHWATSWNPFTNSNQFQEQMSQRVDYHYDTNPLDSTYSQNALGRLAAVEFRDANNAFPYFYEYSYNQAGRVTAQHMDDDGGAQTFDASYTWDTEGRMTGINY